MTGGPIFVVGHPRSGTTLVQMLLAAHPGISSGPETHLFSYVLAPLAPFMQEQISPWALRHILKRLAAKPRIRLPLKLIQELQVQARRGKLDVPRLLDRIMREADGRWPVETERRWLEKTPLHIGHVHRILRMFPDATVINVVRDARDVVSSHPVFIEESGSWRRKWELVRRARSWSRMVGEGRVWESDARVLSIRYEDLVTDSEASLSRVFGFVGEQPNSKYLQSFSEHYHDLVLPSEADKKGLLRKGRIVDRRGIWTKRLTVREAMTVQAICAKLMIDYGYLSRQQAASMGRTPRLRRWYETMRVLPMAAVYTGMRSIRSWTTTISIAMSRGYWLSGATN